ncbi:M64 family metallopeptidase [uncultured Psychroserpens sp.]|uniref:M64 family metallopeptidase n=1 Tax=uncultured Psychroserpens sp. TaxID=255436 RepID=UPI002615CF2C|nr:M64 family metallopeptidase [uncultured Psychroserpens sp.]
MSKSYKLIIILFLFIFSCSKDAIIENLNDDNTYYRDGEVEIVFENDATHGINIIFMGDGYVKNELKKDQGRYREHALENIEFLFQHEPFKFYKNHFNAYIIYAESEITPHGNTFIVDTPFDSHLTTITPYSNALHPIIQDLQSVNDYVFKVKNRNRTDKDLILMSVNNVNGGTAGRYSNLAVFGNGERGTMLHEVGHAFGGLGDEYYFLNVTGTPHTDYPNMDNTDNLEIIKWKHFIGHSGYENVGAFEGGAYHQFNTWRPEEGSIMRGNTGLFNAPSRESIVKRILQIRGLTYNFEDFLINDNPSQNRKPINLNKDIKLNNCLVE